MEALGAAASVAGLISLALEIPKIIDTIITIKSAPEEAKQFLQTVAALVATLQRLEAFLKSDEAEDLELKDDSILTVLISVCKDRVLPLLKKLRSHLPKTSGTRLPGLKAVKETATRLRWPFDKTECLSLVTEINAMQNSFEFCLSMQNYRQMAKSHREIIGYFKEQGDSLDKIEAFFPDLAAHISIMLEKIRVFESYLPDADQKLSNIQAAVEELQMANKDFIEQDADNLYGQALEWLSPIDPSEKHQKIADARLPETCEWIFTNAHFEQWVKTPPSDSYSGVTCWVGDPGQGKTFAMSRIIDYLDELRLSDDTICISYLYCDYQCPEVYSETSLAGAIVRQLLTQFDQLPKEVNELVQHSHIKHRRPNARMDEVIKVLTHLSSTVKRLLVCIDALDECKKADNLVAACAKFPLPTSFIFLGRGSIVQTVKQFFPFTIYRPMELQQKDVDAIVIDKIRAEKRRQPELMPGSLEKAIRSGVGKLANGMLLIASLHTTLVLSHDTVHHRQEALNDLSSTLEDTFGRSIARIREGRHCSRAFQILAWIHLVRPLRLDELAHALAIECHHTRFYRDNQPSPVAILDCCLGLVKLDNPKGLNDISDHSTTVTLVHSSLRAYLDSNPKILRELAPKLAETCLAYHSFNRLDQSRILDPLMSSSWLQLLRKSRPLSPHLEDRVWNYCRALNACINQSKTYQELGMTSVTLPSHAMAIVSRIPMDSLTPTGSVRQAMLNTICMLGLDTIDEILSRLTKLGEQLNLNSVDSHDSFGVTPLGWVLFPIRRSCEDFGAGGSLPAFESLDEGLQNAQRVIKQFPMFDPAEPMWHTHALAAIRGTVDFTGSLYHLEFPYRSPFLFLLERSLHNWEAKEVISQIERSTDANFWSPFRRCTRTPENHAWSLLMLRPCVQFGTESEAYWESDDDDDDSNDDDDNGMRRFIQEELNGHISALFGPQSSVPLCIMRGPGQERCRQYCDTRAGVRKDTTQRLPDALHRTYIIPREALLHVGAASDSPQVVNYAISQCSVDKNGRDDKGQTALQVALRFQSLSTAEILIQQGGSDLSARDSTGVTLLHVCAQNGYTQFAQTILRKHPELINLVDQSGKTALHYATSRVPRPEVVQSPRTASRVRRLLGMVQLLLANGADINIEDDAGNTPLHQAVLKGSSSLELLSQANISASNFQRAWDLAFKSEARSVMSLLRRPSLKPSYSMSLSTSYGRTRPVISYNNRTVQLLLATQGVKDLTAAELAFVMELSHDSSVPGEASPSSMDVINAARTIRSTLDSGERPPPCAGSQPFHAMFDKPHLQSLFDIDSCIERHWA